VFGVDGDVTTPDIGIGVCPEGAGVGLGVREPG
jgi:hypothetical protein